MLTLSAKAVYGLCAVTELGIQYNTGPVQIRDIAERHEIPQHYLEQLLVTLKKAGLVASFRGAQGGYALARPPSQTNVLDVLSVLDGRIAIVPEKKRNNALAFFWKELEDQLRTSLDISLEQLILRKQRHDNSFAYTI